jgi:hypothetical protein
VIDEVAEDGDVSLTLAFRAFPRSPRMVPSSEVLQRIIYDRDDAPGTRLSDWRDRTARTYPFRCDLELYESGGVLFTEVTVPPSEVEQTIDELLGEIADDLGERAPDRDELAAVRARLEVDEAGATDEDVAAHLADALVYGEKPMPLSDWRATLRAVPGWRIRETAAEIFRPSRLAVVAFGRLGSAAREAINDWERHSWSFRRWKTRCGRANVGPRRLPCWDRRRESCSFCSRVHER